MHQHVVGPTPLDGQSPHHKIWSRYRCKPIVDKKSQNAAGVRKLLQERRGCVAAKALTQEKRIEPEAEASTAERQHIATPPWGVVEGELCHGDYF
jgi:hypothetical protein